MVYWGEHMFFEKSFETTEEFEMEKLKISIMDYKLMRSNALVGSTELDMVSVYFNENHAFEHKWVILANMSKDLEKIMGFLKFSV